MGTRYYVLDSESDDMMLLYEPASPSDNDDWFGGKPFMVPPAEPVVVEIQPGEDEAELLPYFGTSTLMTREFHAALTEAGVDNLDVYTAVIRSEDGATTIDGYLAFNLVGLVSAADLSATKFNDPLGIRLIDASIDGLEIDETKARGLLMFRLAEYVGAVIVHEHVRNVIERRKFRHIVFREPHEFVS